MSRDTILRHRKTLWGMVWLAVGATGYGLYISQRPPVVFIDQVAIHASLAPFPYSDEAVRERVLREINGIQDQARTRFPRISLSRPRELPEFKIPATPFYVRSVARWVEWALGKEPTAIRIVVTRPIANFNETSDPYVFEAEIRTIGSDTSSADTVETLTLKATKPPELITVVSREIVRRRSPYMLASYFESEGHNAEALTLIDGILDSSDVAAKKWAFNLKGIVLSNLEQFDQALDATEQALKLDPRFAAAYNTKGTVLHNKKMHEAALAAYDQALSLDSGSPSILFNRATELADVGRKDEALQALDLVATLTPNNAGAYIAKGQMLEDRGLNTEAVAAFDSAIKSDPRSRDAHYEKGRVLIKLNRHDDALAATEEALKIDSAFASAYVNKALLQQLGGKNAEALESLEKAIANDPRSVEAHVSKGVVLLAMDRREDAWDSNELALSIEPANAKAQANRGGMYNMSGNFERGLEASERAIALDPGNPMAYLNKAQALLQLTNREREALEPFAQAARLQPTMHEAYFGRALAYARIGRFEECRAELPRAIDIEPNDAEYHDLLAVCLASLGQKAEADTERRLARDLRESVQ